MPLPKLPLEILFAIAHHMRDDHGELRYGDFNSFLQVNRALHAGLNPMLWKEAGEHKDSTYRALFQLINTNNLARLESFLELGADVDFRFDAFAGILIYRPSTLHIAADKDNLPLARLVLEKGASVQFCDKQYSPLHAARSAEMVQLLLDHNADPDIRDEVGMRPLSFYVRRNNLAAVRVLLQHGADVNASAPLKKPILVVAQRSLDSVELLVEHGADLQERDFKGNTPLHLAAAAGKLDVVRFLVGRWPEGKQALNDDGKTPLLMFEEDSRHDDELSDEEKEGIVALLSRRILKPISIKGKNLKGGLNSRRRSGGRESDL
jgi:hypothetical protein